MTVPRTQSNVSVVTPCYNGALFLRGSIDSMFAQTLSPLEVIIVDDGSSDDSAAVAEAYGPPVRVIRQSNRGAGAARAHGVRAAHGEFICFQDADDVAPPRRIETLLRALREHEDCVAAFGVTENARNSRRGIIEKLGGAVDGSCEVVNNSFERMLRDGTPLAGAMNLITRRNDALDASRHSNRYRAANDYVLQLRLARRGDFVLAREVTCHYSPRDTGICGTTQQALQPALAVCAAMEACGGGDTVDDTAVQAVRRRLTEGWPYWLSGLMLRGHWGVAARLANHVVRQGAIAAPYRGLYWGAVAALQARRPDSQDKPAASSNLS